MALKTTAEEREMLGDLCTPWEDDIQHSIHLDSRTLRNLLADFEAAEREILALQDLLQTALLHPQIPRNMGKAWCAAARALLAPAEGGKEE
jgi:hypothetical protein